MANPILISISPNITKDDVLLALKTIFTPQSWQQGSASKLLSQNLKKILKQDYCWLLNLGRTALQLGLEVLELKSTDEVLCQAFTCVAVPNAIKAAGAKPVYIDTIKNGFNLSISDLTKKITKNSKVLIIQHTFGNPDDIDKIKNICKKHNLTLIEDCAHSLGVNHKGKSVGSFGDLTMLSFGRDKVISSVFGGALLASNKDLAKKIDKRYNSLNYPSLSWIKKQLLHPIITGLIKPIYFTLGKYLMFIYQKSSLLTWPVLAKEKQGQSGFKIKKMPNALSILANHQLEKLEALNQRRQKIVKLYHQIFEVTNLEYFPLLRYPILVNNPERVIKKAKQKKILLGDWYRPVIAPSRVDLKIIGYKLNSCPNAETVSKKIINLPTLITKSQAQTLINLIYDHR